MKKIKILAISIILFFSTIQLSLADEQQVNFYIFDNNNDDSKKYSVEIPINVGNYEIKKTTMCVV